MCALEPGLAKECELQSDLEKGRRHCDRHHHHRHCDRHRDHDRDCDHDHHCDYDLYDHHPIRVMLKAMFSLLHL